MYLKICDTDDEIEYHKEFFFVFFFLIVNASESIDGGKKFTHTLVTTTKKCERQLTRVKIQISEIIREKVHTHTNRDWSDKKNVKRHIEN